MPARPRASGSRRPAGAGTHRRLNPAAPFAFRARPQGFLLRPGPAGKPVSTCGRIALRQAGHCGRNKRLELERRQETQETGRAGRGVGGAAPDSRRERPASISGTTCLPWPASSPWPAATAFTAWIMRDVINELFYRGRRDLIGLDRGRGRRGLYPARHRQLRPGGGLGEDRQQSRRPLPAAAVRPSDAAQRRLLHRHPFRPARRPASTRTSTASAICSA